jgi:hypothetical protein
MTGKHRIRPADDQAVLEDLLREFAGRWHITRSQFPHGRMFAARPLPADGQSQWVARPDAAGLRAEIHRREAAPDTRPAAPSGH